MKPASRFSLTARLRSLRDASAGLVALVTTEHNARIHVVATVAVIGAGLWVGLTRAEWAMVVVAMALVWISEASNSALEALADTVHPERDRGIGLAKDLAAAAVLIAALAAIVLGLLAFGPHLRL